MAVATSAVTGRAASCSAGHGGAALAVIAFGLCCLLLGASSPVARLAGSAWAQPASAPPSVTVHAIQEKDVTPQLSYVGRVVAKDTVDIRARIQGILESKHFLEGGRVEKGQLLFTIEKEPYEIVVAQRQAELAGAEARLVKAKADFKRKSDLVGRDVVSQAVLEDSRANMLTGEADVQKAKAALRAAQLDLSYTDIQSPVDGRINIATYSVGSLVDPSSEPLATVVRTDPIHVKIGVSEKQLIAVRRRGVDLKNPPVAPKIQLSDGSQYDHAGRFDYLAPNVDRGTDTIVARAIFPNPKEVLLPGQFVSVIIRPKQKQRSIVVPQVAVQRDSKGYFVLVIDRQNRVEVRRIETKRQDETDWVVASGLVTGERVIVDGIQKVRPAMVVNPVQAM